jgi:hypothetical protein
MAKKQKLADTARSAKQGAKAFRQTGESYAFTAYRGVYFDQYHQPGQWKERLQNLAKQKAHAKEAKTVVSCLLSKPTWAMHKSDH